MNLLLRLFGIKPDPSPPLQTWECPTCGHEHPVGTYVLGQVVPNEILLRQQYEDGRINLETFERLLDGVVSTREKDDERPT